jgi:hypothetical protein
MFVLVTGLHLSTSQVVILIEELAFCLWETKAVSFHEHPSLFTQPRRSGVLGSTLAEHPA